MRKTIRILIALIVILSFVLLGRNEAAWAANSGESLSSSAAEASSPWTKGNDCDEDEEGNCDEDDGIMDDDDRDDDDRGTVKPPKRRIKICKTGQYSVGGVVTLEVKKLGGKDCIRAMTQAPGPNDPPPPAGSQVLSDILSLSMPKENTLVKICFAVPPGEQAQIYAESRRTWKSMGTSIRNGIACTEAVRSGTYALIGK